MNIFNVSDSDLGDLKSTIPVNLRKKELESIFCG